MKYLRGKFELRTWTSEIARRRGSVLILVVVLCVLLALMGTALLSTTRNDRYVAAQNSANTETDLLMEGVKQIAISTITDSNNRFSSTDWNWDMPYLGDGIPTTPTHDIWLSPRAPEGITQGGVINLITWPTLGILPTLAHFDDPNPGPGAKTYGIRDTALPRDRPAFNPALSWQIGGNNPGAADADGDGIADSGFFVLPVGALDGVTYYAALRIIDNNSAVNVNTALSATTDYDFNGAAVDALGTPTATAGNLGAFRSHVGLAEMLHDYNHEFAAIVKYRNNNVAAPTAAAYDNTGAPINGVTFITQGDMYDHMLADRLLNPGCLDSSKTLFNPFLTSDAQALAHHFVLPDPGGSKSNLESILSGSGAAPVDSVYGNAMNMYAAGNSSALGRKAYPAGSYVQWFDENFNHDSRNSTGGVSFSVHPPGFVRPIRPLLTTYNPVSNQIVPKYLPTPPNPPLTLPAPEMEPYRSSSTTPSGAAIKTNINTASFGELYRAFWCVMADNLATTGTPYPLAVDPATDTNGGVYRGMKFVGAIPDVNAAYNPQRMFRSSIRDPRATGANVMRFSNAEQLKLRAAAAATQAIYLRDHTKTSQTVQLTAQGSAAGTVNVKLFPAGGSTDAAQPFIVEVFAWYEKNPPPLPPPLGNGPPQAPAYVAIKLYNPFPVPVTMDGTWKIRAFNRTAARYTPPFQGRFNDAVSSPFLTTPVTIPPNGVLVIDNFDSAGLMSNRPVSSGLDPNSPPGSLDGSAYQYMSITGLNAVLNNEMIITQDVDGTGDANTKPIDSFDFTGFDPNTLTGLAWHYERPYGTSDNPERRWMCVYPGRYDGSLPSLRHQGIEQSDPWNKASGTSDPWTTPHGHLANNASIKTPTYPSLFSIQLTNQDWPGPNAGAGKFPFGGFARNGDILQVPFIAAYTISLGGQVIDMNSISMDAAFAEDSDPSDDYPNFNANSMPIPPTEVPGEQREQIGRFCPIRIQNTTATKTVLVDDYETDPTKVSYDVAGATPEKWQYRWARGLFDYLTVQSPASDYLPNDWSAIKNGTAKPVQNDPNYPAADESNFNSTDIPTQNNVGAEDTVGVQGLININTAPWKVLAAIPWVPKGQPSLLSTHIPPLSWDNQPPGTDDNDMIAQAIVRWRDGDLSHNGTNAGNGPFKSIFDLYAVTAVNGSGGPPFYVLQTLQQAIMTASDPGVAQGDFSPNTLGTTDQARYDFEEQTLLLTKVSNLLTTRSDTFTVYILLQGWRGVGGSKPTKVVERRAAMIVDRTPATKDNPAKINRWDLSND